MSATPKATGEYAVLRGSEVVSLLALVDGIDCPLLDRMRAAVRRQCPRSVEVAEQQIRAADGLTGDGRQLVGDD